MGPKEEMTSLEKMDADAHMFDRIPVSTPLYERMHVDMDKISSFSSHPTIVLVPTYPSVPAWEQKIPALISQKSTIVARKVAVRTQESPICKSSTLELKLPIPAKKPPLPANMTKKTPVPSRDCANKQRVPLQTSPVCTQKPWVPIQTLPTPTQKSQISAQKLRVTTQKPLPAQKRQVAQNLLVPAQKQPSSQTSHVAIQKPHVPTQKPKVPAQKPLPSQKLRLSAQKLLPAQTLQVATQNLRVSSQKTPSSRTSQIATQKAHVPTQKPRVLAQKLRSRDQKTLMSKKPRVATQNLRVPTQNPLSSQKSQVTTQKLQVSAQKPRFSPILARKPLVPIVELPSRVSTISEVKLPHVKKPYKCVSSTCELKRPVLQWKF